MSKSSYLKLFFFLTLAAPVIDIGTGYFTAIINYNAVTPGIIFKGGLVLPIFLWFCIKSKSKVLILFFVGIFTVFVTTFYNSIVVKNVEILSFAGHFLKIIYPFLGFGALKYIHEKKVYIPKETLWKLGYYIGFITVLGVIVFSFTEVGVINYSQADYTSSGLYNAGNDTGLVIIISYCLFLYYNQNYQSKKLLSLVFVSSIYFIAVLILYTRAALLGLPIAFLLILGYGIFRRGHKTGIGSKVLVALLMGGFVWLGISTVDYLIENNFAYTLMRIQALSAGDLQIRMIDDALNQIAGFNIFEHLIGVGEANFPLVENDLIDIYGRYGLFFSAMVFSTILYFLIKIYASFFKKRSLANLSLSIALTFYVFHGSVAGHAFASGQVNCLIMIVYFLIYDYAKSKHNEWQKANNPLAFYPLELGIKNYR